MASFRRVIGDKKDREGYALMDKFGSFEAIRPHQRGKIGNWEKKVYTINYS